MDIIQNIHNLQKKPKPARRRILIVAVIIGMALIIGLWLATINKRISTTTVTGLKNDTASARAAESPFILLKNTVEESFDGLQTLLK